MSPIETRHRVRAQPIALESGIEFRDRRADLIEDVREAMKRVAVRVESVLTRARLAGSMPSVDLHDRTAAFTAGTSKAFDRIAEKAARGMATAQLLSRKLRSDLEPWIAEVSAVARPIEARLRIRERALAVFHWTEARLGRMEFEGYMGAAIVLVALAILVHGIAT